MNKLHLAALVSGPLILGTACTNVQAQVSGCLNSLPNCNESSISTDETYITGKITEIISSKFPETDKKGALINAVEARVKFSMEERDLNLNKATDKEEIMRVITLHVANVLEEWKIEDILGSHSRGEIDGNTTRQKLDELLGLPTIDYDDDGSLTLIYPGMPSRTINLKQK